MERRRREGLLWCPDGRCKINRSIREVDGVVCMGVSSS